MKNIFFYAIYFTLSSTTILTMEKKHEKPSAKSINLQNFENLIIPGKDFRAFNLNPKRSYVNSLGRILIVSRDGNIDELKKFHSRRPCNFIFIVKNGIPLTPLTAAAFRGKIEAVKYLISGWNADVNFHYARPRWENGSDATGVNALQAACMNKQLPENTVLEIVKFLVENGANINHVAHDPDGIVGPKIASSTLRSARKNGYERVYEFLTDNKKGN